VMIVCVE